MLEEYNKVQGILKVKELGLPCPETLFVKNLNAQLNNVNNFLLGRDYVMIRSDHKNQRTHCPRVLKCKVGDALKVIKELNETGYVAILQEYVPLNNRYSGNILVLNNEFIIEAIMGGPLTKLNRDGLLHEHIRVSGDGQVLFHHGEKVIPKEEIKTIIDKVKNLPVKHNILEFSSGPDWFYFWHVREDPSSKLLE
jgi:uncharacterized protein YlzI (FlbEa/FlbD family)